METFTVPKELAENPHFEKQKRKSLAGLTESLIDATIRDTIKYINNLTCCFTLQCCYGHFVYQGQKDPHNLEPLPEIQPISKIEYRIAYIAFCIQNSKSGRRLLAALKEITEIDPQNIQFCSAEWFWQRQVNSYALQVEPDRFKHQDKAMLDYKEALFIEKLRDKFFLQLKDILHVQPAWS